jgi:hypothetical protein
MRYDAEIRIFDMLDQVHVSCRVWATDGLSHEPPELVLGWTYSVQGKGTDQPLEWLAEVLCSMTEALWTRETPATGTGVSW